MSTMMLHNGRQDCLQGDKPRLCGGAWGRTQRWRGCEGGRERARGCLGLGHRRQPLHWTGLGPGDSYSSHHESDRWRDGGRWTVDGGWWRGASESHQPVSAGCRQRHDIRQLRQHDSRTVAAAGSDVRRGSPWATAGGRGPTHKETTGQRAAAGRQLRLTQRAEAKRAILLNSLRQASSACRADSTGPFQNEPTAAGQSGG